MKTWRRLLLAALLSALSLTWTTTEAFLPAFSTARSASLRLHANVATDFVKAEASDGDDGENEKKLSRPERKAVERARKDMKTTGNNRKRSNNSHRKHNYAARKQILASRRQPGEPRYALHSEAVPVLTLLSNTTSTVDDVMRAIKRAQNLHDLHDLRAIERFLEEETDDTFAYGYRGSLWARLAVAALHVDYHRLAAHAMEVRRREHAALMQPMESAALIRGLLRVHNVTDALEILDTELAIPDDKNDVSEEAYQDVLVHRILALCSIASRHFFEGEPRLAVGACKQLAALGPLAREGNLGPADLKVPWERLLRGAAQCQSKLRNSGGVQPVNGLAVDDSAVAALAETSIQLPCNVVYSVLNAMTTFPSENSDRVYETLSNALVRRVLFVTGAVSMQGCPPADRGEAVFIGRSNVGKSSLVNMITNRKSLAYTSKRPGKTQQFNFFAVNDKPDREKEIRYGDHVPGKADPDSFHIVDVPGFGFAKVPEKQRQEWAAFLQEYVSTRRTLRVVFHLVDGRHGPTSEDATIMASMAENLPRRATYVVVLTKADKNVKSASTKNSGKVSDDVMNSLRKAMKEKGVGNAPVILSSAETKLGRDDLWRYLRLAAEG